MKRGDRLENIAVEKLVFGGKGFARIQGDEISGKKGRVLFIRGGALPGSVVNLKVTKKKKDYAECQITEIITKSPLEQEHPNNPHGMTGGCKWVNIPYSEQLKIKQQQVEESLFHLKKYQDNLFLSSSCEGEVPGKGDGGIMQEIIPSPLVDGYRNKVEFSFGKYISHKEDIFKHFEVGFHKQGSFSQIQDVDGCILIDEIQNTIYKEIKDFSKTLGLPVYDQKTQKGFFRHLMIRRTFFADEIMILLSFNPEYELKAETPIPLTGASPSQEEDKKETVEDKLEKIKIFFGELCKKHSIIKSVYFSYNTNKADACIGDLELVHGKKTINEALLGLTFEISPQSFFQTNSYGAEVLYSTVLELAKGDTTSITLTDTSPSQEEDKSFGTVLDLYGGTGTIGMIFAHAGAKDVISVELSTSASKDGEKNAAKNNLDNIQFVNAKVEDFLGDYLNSFSLTKGKDAGKADRDNSGKADLLIIDPPRAGMHPKALPNILKFQTNQIIYVSCNPATLARDLEYILDNSDYVIETVVPVDMFPHTHHIETIVSLRIKT